MRLLVTSKTPSTTDQQRHLTLLSRLLVFFLRFHAPQWVKAQGIAAYPLYQPLFLLVKRQQREQRQREFTLLRSAHVFKKSQEHFAFRTYSRQISLGSSTVCDTGRVSSHLVLLSRIALLTLRTSAQVNLRVESTRHLII